MAHLPSIIVVATTSLVAVWTTFRRRAGSPREIDRLPRVPIGDAGERRRVKIVGKVRILGKQLVAPLSERPCALYQALVEDHSGTVIVRETDGQDFLVEDDTGLALVRVKSAQLLLKLDAQYQSEVPHATSRQWALLQRHVQPQPGLLRYREGTLTPGETVAIVGTPYLEVDPDPRAGVPFREMPMRLVFAADRDTLHISDDL